MKKVPLHSLILLIGPVGPSKGNLVRDKFEYYECVSNDDVRISLVGDKFRHDLNHLVEDEIVRRIEMKLKIGERVIVDSSNLTPRERMKYVDVGDSFGVPIFYVIVGRSKEELRMVSSHGLSDYAKKNDQFFKDNETQILRGDGRASVIDYRKEDFEVVKKFDSGNMLNQIKSRGFNGITVAGDIHGNLESLKNSSDWAQARHCLLLQLGDVVDYGPKSVECVNMLYDRVTRGRAIMVIGNHENKIERWLKYQEMKEKNPDIVLTRKGPSLSDANKATTDQIEAMSQKERKKFESRFATLMNLARHHWVIGDVMFVHGAADMPMWKMTGSRLTSSLESLALYGETDKSPDAKYPERLYNWVDKIPPHKTVIVGHDIRDMGKPKTVKGVRGGTAVFMDTGSSKGGHLSSADLVIKNGGLVIQNFNWL